MNDLNLIIMAGIIVVLINNSNVIYFDIKFIMKRSSQFNFFMQYEAIQLLHQTQIQSA